MIGLVYILTNLGMSVGLWAYNLTTPNTTTAGVAWLTFWVCLNTVVTLKAFVRRAP